MGPSLFHNRIHVHIPRLSADIGMQNITPQQPLLHHTRLLHHACRTEVLYIANGLNAENIRLGKSLIDDSAQGFGHVPLAPVRTCRHIADFEFQVHRVQTEHADQRIIFFERNGIGEIFSSSP